MTGDTHEPDPWEAVERSEAVECVRDGLAALTEDQKHLIHMVHFLGIPRGKAALLLGLGQGRIHQRLQEAYASLASRLGDWG